MQDYVEDSWIEKVKHFSHEGEMKIDVPLTAMPRSRAIKLAIKLGLQVFVQGRHYIFAKNWDGKDSLLNDTDALL